MAEIQISFLGTGAGASMHRAHTAMALECPDGTRLLLDGSSGNSVLRGLGALGKDLKHFEQVLLSHHHPDHMSGLLFVQFMRAYDGGEESPLRVYSTDEAVDSLKSLCQATRLNIQDVDQDGGRNASGRQVIAWEPASPGQKIKLGPETTAWNFLVDHISGAAGWRIESGGLSVVFSGDTRFSPNLVEASQGADLLIHEAMCTDDQQEDAARRGHATAGEAARAAAQAGVGELVLTHIDNPYHKNMQPLLDEAKAHFDGPVAAAHDLLQMTVGGT